jgi:DNA-binding transcriptional ArsR family regulator
MSCDARRTHLRRGRVIHILNHMVQYNATLDRSFAALADPTRRGILARLGRADASITDLAGQFGLTLTGLAKHVIVLESAGLVRTIKLGRVRVCTLSDRPLDAEMAYLAWFERLQHERFDRLAHFLDASPG